METIVNGLENYRRLVTRIDRRCREIEAAQQGHIVCRKGCDECCRHISVFAVEAVAMARALSMLAPTDIALIRRQAASAQLDGPCPLLFEGVCLLYDARPIICRTHGLPILLSQEGKPRVDFCPKNFSGIAAIPGDAAIYLERINEALATINRMFTETFLPDVVPLDRFTIAETLLLEIADE